MPIGPTKPCRKIAPVALEVGQRIVKSLHEATKVGFVDAPSARLAVFVTGGTKDPIILLHGGPGVPDYLGAVASTLSAVRRMAKEGRFAAPAAES